MRELSPIMLAAREGLSKLCRRRSRWRRWQGEWHRIWLYCVHPGNRVAVARYGACKTMRPEGPGRGGEHVPHATGQVVRAME